MPTRTSTGATTLPFARMRATARSMLGWSGSSRYVATVGRAARPAFRIMTGHARGGAPAREDRTGLRPLSPGAFEAGPAHEGQAGAARRQPPREAGGARRKQALAQ